MRSFGSFAAALLVLVLLAPAPSGAEPFKVGTFEHRGRMFLGMLLRDRFVVDIAAANRWLERRSHAWVRLPDPGDMNELIGRYDREWKPRLHAIASELAPRLDGSAAPDAVFDLAELDLLPPVAPAVILAAALNYPPHRDEMTTGQAAQMSTASAIDDDAVSMPHLWERRPGDRRQNPYLFFKPPSIVVADGEPIRVKPGRDQIDWECELAVVVGPPASDVPLERAREHVFGYTLMNDVGDRGGRGDNRYGSDWLVWKSSQTFAPLGPFIVPKEFVPDPHALRIWLTLSGQTMQDADTGQMIHSVDELLHFASNNLILRPGDVVATGTPGGVGIARTPPVFMKPGDVVACSVEGIGTLTNPIERW